MAGYLKMRRDNMTKTKLNELMKEYCIAPSELDDVFAFVADLLYLKRKELFYFLFKMQKYYF